MAISCHRTIRDAWLNCERARNAINLQSDFGAGDWNSGATKPVDANLQIATHTLREMLGYTPKTVRGAWAYLELMRDLANHLRLNPQSSISDIDYAAHLAGISKGLECHVYTEDDERMDAAAV